MWKGHLQQGFDQWAALLQENYSNDSLRHDLENIRQDAREVLTIMIAGEFKAGKSTFINALLGEAVLTSDVIPATAVITKLTYGPSRKVLGHFRSGKCQEFGHSELEQLSAEVSGMGIALRQQLSYVEVQFPLEFLKSVTIVDSPGLNSDFAHHTEVTNQFMERADVAFWIFNYQGVGTDTEVEVIQKIKQAGITCYGIVNRIDLHDNEEGDLDDFLKENTRRLQGLFDQLYGVSAKLALEGKVEGDSTKLQWSNWDEVESLVRRVQEQQSLKHDRLFHRLDKLLLNLDALLLHFKSELPLAKYLPLLEVIEQNDYPRILALKQFIEQERDRIMEEASSWQQVYEKNISTKKELEQVLTELMALESKTTQHTVPVTNHAANDFWQSKCLPTHREFISETSALKAEFHPFLSYRANLVARWNQLERRKRRVRTQPLQTFQNELDHCNRMYETLMTKTKKQDQKKENVIKVLRELHGVITGSITEQLEQFEELLDDLVSSWEDEFESLNGKYSVIQTTVLDQMIYFFSWIERFTQAMAPFFYVSDKELMSSQEYQQFKYRVDNVANLHVHFDFREVKNKLQILLHLQGPLHKKFNASTKGAILSYELLKPDDIQLPGFLSLPVSSRIDTIFQTRRKWAKGVTFVAVAVAIVVFVYTHSPGSTPTSQVRPIDTVGVRPSDPVGTSPSVNGSKTSLVVDPVSQGKTDKAIAFIQSLYHQVVQQGQTSKGFTKTTWIQFKPIYESIHNLMQTSYKLVRAEPNPDGTVAVDTIEQYGDGHEQLGFVGHYTVDVSPTSVIVSNFSYSITDLSQSPDEAFNADQITAFLQKYRASYMKSLNSHSTAIVTPFLTPQGPASQELTDYIQSLARDRYQFDFQKLAVTNIELSGPNQVLVNTTENFVFTSSDGTKTGYERNKQYNLIKNGNTQYLIDSISILDTKKSDVTNGQTVSNADSSDSEITKFITSYYKDFVSAFNGKGFSLVSSYYAPNSKEYQGEKSYMDVAIQKHMSMQNLNFAVSKVKALGNQSYLVDVNVTDKYFYQDGTGDQKRIAAEYKLTKALSGQLQIEEITSLNILEKTEFSSTAKK